MTGSMRQCLNNKNGQNLNRILQVVQK